MRTSTGMAAERRMPWALSRPVFRINARIAALSRGLASSDVQREVMLLEELAVAGLRLHAGLHP